jgi:hypothetical protein
MRKLLILSGIILLLVVGECLAQGIKLSGVVNIKDVRKLKEPAPDLANHKDRDIEVCRVMNQREGNIPAHEAYVVYFYRKENDTLRRYQVSYRSNENMDKAEYKWLDDTLASVRIFRSGSKKEITLKVFGHHDQDGTKTSGSTINY